MQEIKQILDSLKAQDNYRILRDLPHSGAYLLKDSKKLLNLASNDYLGITSNAKITHKFDKWLKSNLDFAPKKTRDFRENFMRFSSSSSRLLSGGFPVYEAFESHLDLAFAPQKSLAFNSGYHLNISLLQALGSLPNSLFLLDFYAHASVIDGILLGGADFKRFRHNDISHLRELLESRAKNYENIFIISEGVFSMEGDFAPLREIIALKNEYKKRGKNVYIYLDEAHSVGVFGKDFGSFSKDKNPSKDSKKDKNFLHNFTKKDFAQDFSAQNDGLGLARALGAQGEIDFLVFTFGKAIGSVGACVICEKIFRDFFVNKARGLIYSTALPPINVAFSYFVFLHLREKMLARRRENLAKISAIFRHGLGAIASKYELSLLGRFHIISLVLGENAKAIKLAQKLESSGIYAPAIKYPTVSKNTARIRFSLNANITPQKAQKALEILETHIKSAVK